jgi:excisionase family DNA binding protein
VSYNPGMIDDLQALTPQATYSDWLTKAEAGQALGGLSVRQVERLIAAGKIQTASRPVPHRTAACVCNPGDVARMALERRASQPFVEVARGEVLPGGLVKRTTDALEVRSVESLAPAVRAMLQAFASDGAAATAAASTPKVPITQKAYLTLDEAVEYSGLTKSYLLMLIRQSRLLAVKTGGWRVSRRSVDSLGGI